MARGRGPIRVLVIDDSALVRKVLCAVLNRDPAIRVVETAADPYEAREKIKSSSPDVLTLDVEMPRMDGFTFLRNLMRLRPMPVVMVSSLTERGADLTLAALETGAVDYVCKPALGVEHGLEQLAEELCDKIKVAAASRIVPWAERTKRLAAPGPGANRQPFMRTTDRVIAIGASTGGTEAIADLLAALPPDTPGILVAQHIPEAFSGRFAARLDALCAPVVREASDGEPVLVGHVYVAPGNRHLRLARSGAKYHCRVTGGDPVNRHRPSVDVLFRSVAADAGPNAVGVLLTGMGADGADGLLEMRGAGAPTIAQDRETSVVWGMPGEAVKRGAAADVLPLPKIATRMLELARR